MRLAIGIILIAILCPQVVEARHVVTNTEHAEDLLVAGDALWVATRGGVEVYGLTSQERTKLYTTQDGLVRNHVLGLSLVDGVVTARTMAHSCAMVDARFVCKPHPRHEAEPRRYSRYRGFRVMARVTAEGAEYLALAGDGVWQVSGQRVKRLTPAHQICSNHITAIARYAGRTWFGSFDEGLCSSADGVHFDVHEFGATMINDLEVTPRGLFIAASEGLFVTRDGKEFQRNTWVSQLGVNGLAFDGRSLFVTTPGCLWRLRVRGGPRDQEWWKPGGSRSLQSVAATRKGVWIATEDRGLVRQTETGFDVFDQSAGMPESWFLDVAIDRQGLVYGATLRSGVVRVLRDDSIERVMPDADQWGLFIGAVGRAIWFGSQAGAARLAGPAVSLMEDTPHPNVHVVARVGRTLYVGTEGGLLIERR